jgi:serine/threonine-protein kinase
MPTQRLDPRAVGAAAGGAGGVGMTRAMPSVPEAPTGYQPQGPGRRGYDDEYEGGRPPAGPPHRRVDSRRAPEPEPKGGRTGYVILGVAAVAAVIAAVLLFNTMLKPGGASDTKAVPDLTGKNLADARTAVAAAPGFSLVGTGADCSTDDAKHATPKDTISEQTPAGGGYVKPGPIKYCLSLGPQTGAIPSVAVLNGMTEPQLKAALKAAKFPAASVDAVIATHQNDPKIPKDKIIDVRDQSTGKSVAGTSVDVNSVQLTWIVSDGQQQITVPDGLIGLQYGDAVNRLKALGFKQVTAVPDPGGNTTGQAQGTVTQLKNVQVGQQYGPDQQITLYYAPAPAAPPSNTNTCDQDPSQCQTQPGTPSSSTSSQGGFPGGIGFPPTPTTTKHG